MHKPRYFVCYNDGTADWWDEDQGPPSDKWHHEDEIDELKSKNEELREEVKKLKDKLRGYVCKHCGTKTKNMPAYNVCEHCGGIRFRRE